MSNADYSIGVVGVGRMGSNIARHLKDEGFSVVAVYDSVSQLANSLAGEIEATACNMLADVTKLADYIITVVTDDASMEQIFSETGEDSLLKEAEGTVFINCATISPGMHVEVERRAELNGAESLEGCMASSITQARQGTLYLMCGGRKSTFHQAEPILNAMSVSLRYIGTAGQAAQVKALVNMVMNINTAGLAEGLGLGEALGLDLEMLQEVFSQTGANSRVLETDGEDMQIRDHECYFSAAHAAKDSGIALDLANQVEINLPLAKATKAQFDKMINIGKGDLDKSGVAELTFKGRS
ncbi:2-hydroxy-3-oxopropionate reductase [Candidatus Poribacteria bacterium]|nr:2-hydroxy-3-oxopropionate reductase [Candidatus Poribacteria bacterium]MBP96425.1 2-hydroxy-3-oxopropionate reductase [Candidatus Poribacteria bacterium]